MRSVAFADEIIVLDSGSTDDTVCVCKSFTSQVYITDWPGFGPQKQRALEKASCAWVLSIDADEWVSSALAEEIRTVINDGTSSFSAYELPRLSSYCGRKIRHSGWYPDYCLRLFRRDTGRFSSDAVHEKVLVNGKTGKLKENLEHESFTDLVEVLDKVNAYSTLGAIKLANVNRRTSLKSAVFKAIWAFCRTYFLRAGFLDGREGFMLAISNAEGTYYKYAKLYLLSKKKNEN